MRKFSGLTVESAYNSVVAGKIDVAPFYFGLQYLLPGTLRSVGKVLSYALIRASRGYLEKNISLYTVKVSEVPGFDPDERDKVKQAFNSIVKLGLATYISEDSIRINLMRVDSIIRVLAPFIKIGEVQTTSLVFEDEASYPHKVVGGISSLTVMYEGRRLPKPYTIAMGLSSPTGAVDANGKVSIKSTIETRELREAIDNMTRIRQLRNSFESAHYFEALGFMLGNRIIVNMTPTGIEVRGSFVENVIKPAYELYYKRYYPVVRFRGSRP
ncbi:MAG: hypothetical protein QW290_08015 [Sulfolobales archaeon]